MAAMKLNLFLSGVHPVIRRGENRFLRDAFRQPLSPAPGGYLYYFFFSYDKDHPVPR